jgi:hypothetical protein
MRGVHPEVLAPFDQWRAAREAAEKHEYQQCISAQARVRVKYQIGYTTLRRMTPFRRHFIRIPTYFGQRKWESGTMRGAHTSERHYLTDPHFLSRFDLQICGRKQIEGSAVTMCVDNQNQHPCMWA